MITVENIIDFDKAIKLSEDQIYELVVYMHDHTRNFGHQVNYFYCEIKRCDYFDIANQLTYIHRGDPEHLKKFATDIYHYCNNMY